MGESESPNGAEIGGAERISATLETGLDLRPMLARLDRLRDACIEMESEHAGTLACLNDDAGGSARNLLHYLAIRREDLRDIQGPLAELGLSSLGRNEAHVLANLGAVAGAIRALMAVQGAAGAPEAQMEARGPVRSVEGRALLAARADALLGRAPENRRVRIMVTLPTEAADDAVLVDALIGAGMSCARINTAHDTPAHWERMCATVRGAAKRAGAECRILIDLAGPKLRTGPFQPGPEVVRFRPRRDVFGRVTEPAEVLLTARPTSRGPALPVPEEWLAGARVGDAVKLRDARGRLRVLRVVRRRYDGDVIATTDRTAYITTGSGLSLVRGRDCVAECCVGALPPLPQAAEVRAGDPLILSLRDREGRASGGEGPPVLTCTLPEAFEHVREGERVWFDDGKIGAVVRAVRDGAVELEVTSTPGASGKIGEDKGINLPDSDVRVAGLTPADIETLPLVARHADMVGMSFVQAPQDVVDLRARLGALGGDRIGTVLKIETKRAFENLPSLLLAALQGPCAGVMIARGDLAVECGFERLAEVQEEILWLCEAAHIPVIWATQVLESLAKTGRVSRAEVTDAAMSERAECVMLNKGPYIAEAVRFLDGVLHRMCEHQEKKRSMLRALNVARRFGASRGA